MLRFIRNSIFTMISLLVVISTAAIAQDNQLTRITPEQAGFSSEKLSELDKYLNDCGSSSLLIISDGKVFYEWDDIYKKQLEIFMEPMHQMEQENHF